MDQPSDDSVRWLGHATALVCLAGTRVLTDPLLRSCVGMLRRTTPAPAPRDWAGAHAVLVSHLHLDHADLPSLRMVDAPVLASPRVAGWLRAKGIDAHDARAQWSELPGAPGGRVQVRLAPAEHRSRPLPGRPNDAHGFLLRDADHADHVVWFAGDTADHPSLDEIPDLAGGRVGLALVPIHGWGPRLSPGHLDAEPALDLVQRLGVRRVLPIHHDTFHPVGFQHTSLAWMHEPGRRFVAAAPERAPDVEVLAPAPGAPARELRW